MQLMELAGRTGMAAAALSLAACQPSLAPEPRIAPEPNGSQATARALRMAHYDALLQAMNPGTPVNAEQDQTVRLLADALAHAVSRVDGTAAEAPVLSSAAERALRDFAASQGGEGALREGLERIGAEQSQRGPQQ